MKTTIILAFSAFSLLVGAQPNGNVTYELLLNSVDPGLTFGQSIGDDTWVDEEATGADQTWDLSGFTSQSLISFSSSIPDDPIGAEFFPTANIRWRQQLNETTIGTNIYYHNSEEGTFRLGISSDVQGSDQITTCDDEKQVYDFPWSIGFSWEDSFSSIIAGTASGFQEEEDGVRSAEVDGMGTLILPNGTYQNVYRIKIEETGTTQNYLDGEPFGLVSDFQRFIYEFWMFGLGLPLAVLKENILSGQSFFESQYIIDNPLSTASAARNSNFIIFPNPAGESFQIKLPEGSSLNYLAIQDMTGRLIWEQNQPQTVGDLIHKIELNEFAEGLYVISANIDGNMVSRKLKVIH